MEAQSRIRGKEAGVELAKAATIAALFLGLGVAMYFFLGPTYYLILPFLGGAVSVYLYLGRFQREIDRQDSDMTLEFVRLFTFFGVYVQDGYNVYRALKEIERFASPRMKERLARLSEGIENDKSVEPFIAFANDFEDISIKQVMLAIYQMVDEGQGGVYLRQFERLFGRLSAQKHQHEQEKWSERLQTLSFLPLAGSGIAMVALSLSLVTIMEGAFHVV